MVDDYREVISGLKAKGVEFVDGMKQKEITECEECYCLKFPIPIKEFFSIALPVSKQFYNWKNFDQNNIDLIKAAINWPLEGMLFDVEHNDFWLDKWGRKPDSLFEAKYKCKEEYLNAPKLMPICGHRYIPCIDFERNLPVYSVYQTDVIYYGENLISYLQIEFGYKPRNSMNFAVISHVDFWDDFL